jgi:lipopolysaccharide heptosyltransferase II
MINETREAYPGCSLTLIIREGLSELFEGNQAIDSCQTFPDRYAHGLAGVFKLTELIKKGNYDTSFILPPSFSSASAFKLAGVKERIGYIADGRRLLLTRALPLPEPINSSHRSETYLNLLRRSHGKKYEYTKPKLFLSDDDIARGVSLLEGFGLESSTGYAVVAFRSVAESRRWGVENYTKVAKWLVSELNLTVLLTGQKEDAPEGNNISEAAGQSQVINLAGKTGIRELASIMSNATVFVGNDSGAAHLAAAVCTPIVVLSGADDPAETSPLAARKKLLYLNQLDCISCVKNKCTQKASKYMRCMKGITFEMVSEAIAELISPN